MMILAAASGRRATLFRLVGLGLILWTIFSSKFAPATSGRSVVVLIATVIATASWLCWTFWSCKQDKVTPDLYLFAICGGVIQMASNGSAGSAFTFVACMSCAARVGPIPGLTVAGCGALATGIMALIYDNSGLTVLAYSLGFAATTLGGANIRQTRERAEQAELLLAQRQRSHEEELRSAHLEEQARIARDIHDVLAHSLAGLTIQLEATTALLDQGAEPDLVRARIVQAHELAREGLSETRRAVGALRGETRGEQGGAQVPVSLALKRLAVEYRDADDGPAAVQLAGDVDALPPTVAETIMRAVQEALTNVRKHAAGAAVTVSVDAGETVPALLTVAIEDAPKVAVAGGAGVQLLPANGLHNSGGGYGLRGMNERVQQCGGTLLAGPTQGGWRVELTIPMGTA